MLPALVQSKMRRDRKFEKTKKYGMIQGTDGGYQNHENEEEIGISVVSLLLGGAKPALAQRFVSFCSRRLYAYHFGRHPTAFLQTPFSYCFGLQVRIHKRCYFLRLLCEHWVGQDVNLMFIMAGGKRV